MPRSPVRRMLPSLVIVMATESALVGQVAKTLGDLFADSTNATRNYITLRDKSLDRSPSVFDVRHAFQAYWTLELPFGGEHKLATGNGLLDRVIGGWSLSGITRWLSGKPFRLTSERGTFNNRESGVILNGVTRDELQEMVDFRSTEDGLVYFVDERLVGPDGRANPELIQSPTTPGERGDFVYLRTPPTISTDLALHKNVPIRGSVNLTIYVEALNVFNHPNFLVEEPFGLAVGPDMNINSTQFGQALDVSDPRNVQIRVKLTF